MAIKVELITVDKASELLERILKIRDPDLWETRKKNQAKARAKARRQGKQVSSSPAWPLMNGYNPLERLGLTAVNRTLNHTRVAPYSEEMIAGRWRSAPIQS
jgi:hypothetical protein